MSSLTFLVTELQSLSSETRRKHPEIREAAEKSLAILRASPAQASAVLGKDGPQSEELLRPIFMGCATKTPKVVAISLGSLQRLITMKAVPQSAAPIIISTMGEAMAQGVDIQLRILQTLVSVIPNFPNIHDALLGDALLLCFKLQESRIAVVSSTAAATLRQLLMFVVDKMVNEDRLAESDDTPPFTLTEIKLPDGTTKQVGPSSKDTFAVFEDLCLLANSERPHFLKLEALHKTFALELVESVLSNYHDLFRKHEELILLLRHHLCPLLFKVLSDRPLFPLVMRCNRVIFLLLKQFSDMLETESEVFLTLLIRVISEDGSSEGGVSEAHFHHHVQGPRPLWMRVISMEIMRGICGDGDLVRKIWRRYDAIEGGSKVFSDLLKTLRRLLSEKPGLLGTYNQMGGIGVQHHDEGGSVAGRVASATVSGVVGMITSGSPGLSVQNCSMKLQCIDQLDKADAPPIPESYIYLLAVQSIIALCEGLAAYAGPIYTSLVVQRPRTAGEAAVRAPPAFDLAALPADDPRTAQLHVMKDMISEGWPALLAALSFIIATNLSEELFVEVLASYQSVTNVSGMLGLATARDAFFASLSKFAVPPPVVASIETYAEPPQTPRSATTAMAEGLGLGPAPHQPPSLSERNMACLKVLVGCTMFLAGSLGGSWYGILETLQNAEYVLSFKASSGHGGRRAPGGAGGVSLPSRAVSMSSSLSASSNSGPKHPLLSDLDVETMLLAIQRLFDASKNLDDPSFKEFLDALCKLSSEMVGMQSEGGKLMPVASVESMSDTGSTLSVRSDSTHRRRMSGIHIPKAQVQRNGDFGISKLGVVALLNIHRLIYRSPEIAWNTTTEHLVQVVRLAQAPQGIRVQAARVLDEILQVIPRNLPTNNPELQAEVQKRVLEVLSQQITPDLETGYSGDTTTGVELRRMGLETLHQILQASGHTLVVGWEIIFQILGSVCRPHPGPSQSTDTLSELAQPGALSQRAKPALLGLGNPSEKSYSNLVKIAFQSLTLVCDSISLLSPSHLRLCIATLGQFGRQSDTNIALTAAASLLWSVSDSIQMRRKNVDEEPEYSELWLFLLLEISGLCTDSRPEVRDGAIQTLFRAMQLYGSTLSTETWDQCIWKITFTVLDAITSQIRQHATDSTDTAATKAWDDSKILALQSVGSIFSDFLISKIMLLDSFTEAWDAFVTRVQDSVLLDNRPISAPALRCLEKAIKAAEPAEGVLKPRVAEILERSWSAIDTLGGAVIRRATSTDGDQPDQPFTQESLIALTDVIQTDRRLNQRLTGKEWDLQKLRRLMAILKGVITYPNSPDYRPDIDALPPLQSIVVETIESVDLSIPGSPSLVMRDLSEYATLAFLAAFDVKPLSGDKPTQAGQKRVTYIALSKKIMPTLAELFAKFKASSEVYEDGTIEAVLSAYSIPIKLKYDCPAPSKFGKDDPLWKTATSCFLSIIKECARYVREFGPNLSDGRVEGIWWQILDVYRGAIVADCSVVETFPIQVQESEEKFDLSLIASLEIDVVPHIGDAHVSDPVISQLSRILKQGSMLFDYRSEPLERPSTAASTRSDASDSTRVELDGNAVVGTTSVPSLLPRERFSYWCFDLLFLICSNTSQDQEQSRRRLAALSLPTLLSRCQSSLASYVADVSLRGSMPFPRAREEELVYILQKLLTIRLWSGTLWAALSDHPSTNASSQPSASELGLSSPSDLIADSVKRSTIAHLFYFYSVVSDIASTPGRTPTIWMSKSTAYSTGAPDQGAGQEDILEVDARALARGCLKAIGKEMGVSSGPNEI